MNVYSMTGYANAIGETTGKRIELEIRSVNYRFLDIQFRMPDELRFLEGQLRETISGKISRGKVECRINLTNIQSSNRLNLNQELIDELAHVNQKLRKKHKNIAKLTMSDVLHFPGVLCGAKMDNHSMAQSINQLVEQALQDFIASRLREGQKLKQHIIERLDLMEAIINALEQIFPQLLQAHMTRSRKRLLDAVSNVDEDRLKQEFALFMQKSDVDEEFNRLHTHIAEALRIVSDHQGTIGKRLDFLIQELNREANTLGSKSIASECTQVSVELKVLIEQIREQIQNIE